MYVIDVNTSFGRRVDSDPRYSAAALLERLDDHHVAGALTYSQRGAEHDPRAGNAETIALAAAEPHLIPVGTLDPRDTPGWQAELARCQEAGVRALRFFPGAQRWSVESACFRRVLAALRGSGVCLVFSTTDGPTGWELAREVGSLTAELDLPVVLTDTWYMNMAETMAAMQEFPHLYAETNWLATVGAIETMVNEAGAERLLYGSAAPAHPMQKALNQVLEAEISDDDKVAILGGNAQRLLGLSGDDLAGRPQLADLSPGRFEESSIDVHSHLGYWRFPGPDEDYDPQPMLKRMARYGIQRSILSSYESMRYDIAAGNARLADAIDGHPELLGYVELDPHHLELSCREMDKYYQLPSFAGCELELTHLSCPTGSEKTRALMAEIAKRGKPVLFMPHTLEDARIERELALAHPNLTIIHAHSADASWASIVRDAPNLCVEFCLSRPSHHAVRDCIDILGPERVLFGTDQTLLSVGAAVGLYLDANLTDKERRLILSENAQRVFCLGDRG